MRGLRGWGKDEEIFEPILLGYPKVYPEPPLLLLTSFPIQFRIEKGFKGEKIVAFHNIVGAGRHVREMRD